MKFLPAFCLLSLGIFIGLNLSGGYNGGQIQFFGLCFLASGIAWRWPQITRMAYAIRSRVLVTVTGKTPPPYPTTDPAALAAEMARLNAQMAQLRETAMGFDDSFSQTLHRLDERLRRVEQQSSYIQGNS